MTIVDQYILDHKHEMTNTQMAEKLGVSEDFVKQRKYYPSRPLKAVTVTPEDDLYALVQFIRERKTGFLVDIAEQRIKDISKALNR